MLLSGNPVSELPSSSSSQMIETHNGAIVSLVLNIKTSDAVDLEIEK